MDSNVNVLDIVMLVEWILSGTSLSDLETSIADMTNDGSVNVLDIVALVDIILNRWSWCWLIKTDSLGQEEWKKTGIIKGSKKITAFDIEGNFNPGFLKSFKSLTRKKNKDSKVVFVSNNGDISSILANGFFEQLGYKKMYSLKGGINEWITLENPLIK